MSALKWFTLGCCVSAAVAWLLPEHAFERSSAAAVASTLHVSTFARRLGEPPDFTRLIEQVGPSVVHVTTRSLVRDEADVAEQHFDLYRGLVGGAGGGRVVTGLGSGFVLGDDGYIMTNAHVVEGADEVYVRLSGAEQQIRARVVGVDAGTDIALLRVRANGLHAAPMGSSRSLRVGDWVAAIGSPFGFDNTITAGIVSAKERQLAGDGQTHFLQTDVAINPGSSGGPLVNLRGEVVGINSKIYTRSGGYMGVSFAIPIETALKVSEALRTRGHVARGFLGVETQAVDEGLAASFGLEKPGGALVVSVLQGSPAQRAGLERGDIVLRYGKAHIEQPGDLAIHVNDTVPGTASSVDVWRQRELVHADILIDALPSRPPGGGSGSAEPPSVQSGLVLRERAAPSAPARLRISTSPNQSLAGAF